MDHLDLVSSVLASTTFHPEQVSLCIPLAGQCSIRVYINPITKQITADVYESGKIAYSGVFAADMPAPMCPVFKH